MNLPRSAKPITYATLAAVLAGSVVLAAPPPDTSRWECAYCAVDQDFTGTISGGILSVDSDGEAFEDFSGLKDGTNLRVSGALRQRDGEGGYTDVLLEDLGLRVGRMRVDHGQRGSWAVSLRYQVIPHLTGFDATTPFIGGRDQQLPAAWVPGANSASMPLMSASLQPVSLGADRRRIALAFSVPMRERWSMEADYRHETVRGRRALGANILNTISQLAAPFDRTTDDWRIGGSWRGDRFLASVNYRVSSYSDGVGAITWDNPFVPTVGGATQGRYASTPDNEFQMISGDFRVDLPARTRVSLSFGAGSGEQRDAFIPATINPALTVPALPSVSLRGDVDVMRWNLRVTSRPMRGVGLRFAYNYDDRDNRTPVALYPEVTTDSVVGGFVTNVPYDFRRERTELGVDFRIARGIRAAMEYTNRVHRRSSQEVLETDEDQFSISLRAQAGSRAVVTLELDQIDRTGSDYNVVPGVTDAQNPRLRKFYLADRNRDRARLRLDMQLRDDLALGLEANSSDDLYPQSELGLLEASTTDLAADLTWNPNQHLSFVAYATDQRILSVQAGSAAFSTADWNARDRDDVSVLGARLSFDLEGPWTLSAGFDLSRYDGHPAVSAGAPATAFPDLRSDFTRVDLSLAHSVVQGLGYRFGVLWERLETDDWALDGVSVGTVPSMVALGLTSPTYDAVMVYAELEYGF
jgi:MtrB/PioB family decaheme-associated outer membrane protein